jgi:shikimate kinase
MYPLPLFIVGFTGVGKSTFGMAYAAKEQLPFIDLDDFIEDKEGMTIADIFALNGEAYFRKRESFYLKSMPKDAVIATGGGCPYFFDNMDWMLQHGTVLYLKDSPESIVKKLLKTDLASRPLLAHFTLEELKNWVKKNIKERENSYEKAHYSLDLATGSDTNLR